MSGVQLPVPENLSQYSVYNQLPRSTQPGHPYVGRRNEYQPKGGDVLWLGKAGVGGRQVKLCDPLAITGHI